MDAGEAYHEQELLERIAASDQKAFNQLFESYRNRLFAYLFRITKSKETAEEIVLDVFLKIWTGRAVITEIDNFEAFLFCVAKNKALDFLRWVQKSKYQQIELWNRMQEERPSEMTDSRVLLADLETAVQEVVEQLSPQRKMVFVLSREQGLTYEQIAEKLNISTHTVRNHLAASLQFIRAHLGISSRMAVLLLC